MTREFGRWFRFYDAALDDPKVQRLADPIFRAWVNLLCVASRNAGRIPKEMKDIAFSLRVNEARAADIIAALVKAELMDIVPDVGFEPHNWDNRQFQSDVSTPRVKRFRKRQRNVSGNGDETPSETPPETDTETDTEQKEQRERASAPPPQPDGFESVGKRDLWPPTRPVPEPWCRVAEAERCRLGLAAVDIATVAAKFQAHHGARQNQPRTRSEWQAEFTKFTLNEKAPTNGRQHGKPAGDASAAARILAG